MFEGNMRQDGRQPVFSICIPQFNRTSFLLRALDSFREQTLGDFEVCISDDCSTDGRTGELLDCLKDSGMFFRYHRPEQNGGYDKNIRSSISLAQGRHCLLMGNDDKLADRNGLQRILEQLQKHDWPEVVITNYRELGSGKIFPRMSTTGILGHGPAAAANNYRNFSFVSGVLLNRALAQKHATDKWDGSEMYQMFLGARMIAEGGRLLGIADIVVSKDIQIPEEEVDSYARKPVLKNCRIEERRLPLCQYGLVAFDAVSPFLKTKERDVFIRRIFRQLIMFTYPPWILEYRRIQSWRYAVGICLGMRPGNILGNLRPGLLTSAYLRILYAAVTVAGLLFPISAFETLKPRLYALAKSRR